MAKGVKDKKNHYYKKYQNYYIGQAILFIGWLANSILFFKFYEEAQFYVDKNAKFIMQLLFIVNYYLEDLLKYLLFTFVLMTLNLLLILMFYSKNKRLGCQKSKRNYSMIIFWGIIGINGIVLLKTIVWPLFLLLFITSLTIVYIIYVITNYLYEDLDETYEENERLKKEGPFQTKEEAEKYLEDFLEYWTDPFTKQGYSLVSHINCDQKKEWYVEFIVQSIKKD